MKNEKNLKKLSQAHFILTLAESRQRIRAHLHRNLFMLRLVCTVSVLAATAALRSSTLPSSRIFARGMAEQTPKSELPTDKNGWMTILDEKCVSFLCLLSFTLLLCSLSRCSAQTCYTYALLFSALLYLCSVLLR